jgi:hypothetical protein
VTKRDKIGRWKELPAGFDRLACVGGEKFVSVREEEVEPGSKRWQTVTRTLDKNGLGPAQVLRPHRAGEIGFHTSGLSADGKHYFWLGPREPPPEMRAEVYDVGNPVPILFVPLPHDRKVIPSAAIQRRPPTLVAKGLGRSDWMLHDLTRRKRRMSRPALCISPPTVAGDWRGATIRCARRRVQPHADTGQTPLLFVPVTPSSVPTAVTGRTRPPVHDHRA